MIRRWSCRIVGLYSERVIALDFCRFWTQHEAEAYAERLDALETGPDRVTRVEAYRRPVTTAEWWQATGSAVIVVAGLIALTLIFVADPAGDAGPASPPATCVPVLSDPPEAHRPGG